MSSSSKEEYESLFALAAVVGDRCGMMFGKSSKANCCRGVGGGE
jgi:hypothetical protein